MARRSSAVVLALASAAVAALGAACSLGTMAESAPLGALVELACPALPADARCFKLGVYENRGARSGRVIPLRIAVLPASDAHPAPDPVFFLAGGPGQAATDIARYSGTFRDSLRARRDLVFVDQRGTGGSNVLTCEFYGPPHQVQSYFEPFLPLSKVRECRDRLSKVADLTQYTTTASVEDLEDVRARLGYERINLIGGSYGTRLAMEYVRRYEARVRAVVLEGVATTSAHMPERFGVAAQRALDALLDECAAAPPCASAFPSIREEARLVFARLSEAPVRAQVTSATGHRADVEVKKEHVAEAIRYMTYSSHEAARVPQVLHDAYRGDYSAIAQFLLNWRGDGTFDGLYLAITCTEDVPFVSADAERHEAATYMHGYRIREQRAACAEWPKGAAPQWIDKPVKANVPALLISGALDPVTTNEDGSAVAEGLPKSLHITIPFGGHSPAGLNGLGCLQELKARFLEQASAESLDTSCIAGISRPGFTVRP